MSRQPASARPARTAFTLLELLVVIGIMLVIVALAAGTVLQIIWGQQKKNTELVIKRVDESLKEHVRAVLDQAKELPVPNSVLAIAGNDQRRAKVIWQKLQLKRQFPMTFREALYPWAIDGNPPSTFPGPYPPTNPASPGLGTGLASPLSVSDLPPLDVYVKAYQSAVASAQSAGGVFTIAGPTTFDPNESARLLFLSLSVTRRGTSFNAEQALGPGAILQDAPAQGGLRAIKDNWDLPIVYYRWPTDYPDNLANTGGDLQDPDNTLMDVNWNNSTVYNAPGPILGRNGVYWFEQLCHLVHDPGSGTWTQGRPFYAPPAIVSVGPNKRLGFLNVSSYPTLTPNFSMAIDSTDPQGANDNIVNYTVK
jgi:type II secretory pathway pseudopilin PulG